MCTGTLMVRPLSATALCTACLIHQVAYVENRKPRSGSYFSTAFISPMLPSWIRSSKGSPYPRYFLATETTSLKFFSMSLWRARLSPALVRLLRGTSLVLCARRVLWVSVITWCILLCPCGGQRPFNKGRWSWVAGYHAQLSAPDINGG